MVSTASIFTTLTISERHVEVEFCPSPPRNIEITCTNQFTVLSKVVTAPIFTKLALAGQLLKNRMPNFMQIRQTV
jgi:hypothetical protein